MELQMPRVYLLVYGTTHRLLNSSFLGLPYRILNMNHKKELLKSLWVEPGWKSALARL